jgi:hypothetical protein
MSGVTPPKSVAVVLLKKASRPGRGVRLSWAGRGGVKKVVAAVNVQTTRVAIDCLHK